MYDVIVIGGGPVGSYVAYQLAGLGYGVAVLERKQKIGEKTCCTGIIGRECVETFAIEKDVIRRQANSARLFSPSGKVLRLWRHELQACILDRVAFDRAMAYRAQAKGAEYWLDTSAEAIKIEANRVRIKASRQNFEAKVAVIAAGFGSKLTEELGLRKFADSVGGAQVDVESKEIEEVEIYFGREVAPGFFAWLVPTLCGQAKVGLLSRQNPGFYLKRLLTSLHAQGKIASPEAEISYGGIPLKPLPCTYNERLIVVGDAAGQVKPTTGGGIYYGLLCADIAARTLHRALQRNEFSAKALSRYEREWQQRLTQELRIGYWARRLFEKLSDQQIDRIFDIVRTNRIDEALLKAEELSFDWHSKAILKLLGHQVIARTLKVFKIPRN